MPKILPKGPVVVSHGKQDKCRRQRYWAYVAMQHNKIKRDLFAMKGLDYLMMNLQSFVEDIDQQINIITNPFKVFIVDPWLKKKYDENDP